MARRFRSRRYRPRSARRIRYRKSSLKRIKKDILKCNFPTKVKFMGLTERKVMFLTKQTSLSFKDAVVQPSDDPNKPPTVVTEAVYNHSMYLLPTLTENYTSIVTALPTNIKRPNWDKICVLGIYIKIQPIANTFDGSTNTKKIYPVKCFYAMDNCQVGNMVEYDKSLYPCKQVFTFNSNEAFTIYVPAPTTMDFTTATVHRSKTWWCLATLNNTPKDVDFIKDDKKEDDISEEDYDNDDDDSVDSFYAPSVATNNGENFHCGRLAFECKGEVSFNVTINYKVALKG